MAPAFMLEFVNRVNARFFYVQDVRYAVSAWMDRGGDDERIDTWRWQIDGCCLKV
ncbi:hypothetical protein [Nitrincola sp. A-D6]|uniref:hypothetical protein n=1 Tax=Nitrincola sp. A-D6 TaxID=1545442 RepID=UPI0013641BCA|nr:hypothetical protein [Nitrincola sp. A-D6]